MFEAHVLHLLRKYLGEYVHGLSAEALRISVWKGDVVLKDLKLKAEALNALNLPVTVKAGFLGTITLKVPWNSLGKTPVIVLIDQVFILANPASDGRSLEEEDREKLFAAKLQQIDEAESATLEAMSMSKSGNSPTGNAWLSSLISTIIGNLKISISNVHIRYEDSVSNPGQPFSCGVTLAKLAAVTMDEQGNETFDTSGALDKLRKSLQLERLSVYHDSNRDPWKLDKRWEDISPQEWIEIFEDGINESKEDNRLISPWAQDRNYLVSPINGVLKYHRLGNQERSNSSIPFEKVSIVISDVSLTITEAQYYDWIKLMEAISTYRTHVEVSHLRPVVPVSEGAALWWYYAAQAVLQQKMCYRFSWEQTQNLCHLRRQYVQLYTDSLQQVNVDSSKIRDIEKDLDPKVILLWRFIAHAKVESVKSKEAVEERMLRKRSWFSLGWQSTSEDDSAVEKSSVSQSVEEGLTKEEWEEFNKLLSYQPDEDSTHIGKDMQNTIHYLIIVSISKAAARIVNIDNTEVICGRFENLDVSTKFKHRSTHCDVKLLYYGLSSPEGSIAQSVSKEQKVSALQASFVHSPAGENVDWRLSATISPCHVTVYAESYERFLHFVKRSTAFSPTVALETATALQHKIEAATRRAQEQFQMALEEQSRFALDIDLDGPKVRVPLRSCNSTESQSHLLLDFGHFTIQTMEDSQLNDHGPSLYSRFHISGRDITAFFADWDSKSQSFNWGSQPPISACSEDVNKFYSLIDKCRMDVVVDQIKVPRPYHPSTRISFQIPSLGIHFSPDRYFRLNELLKLFNGAMPNDEHHTVGSLPTGLVPMNPPYLTSKARLIVWKGIGYSVAAWQPCFLVLSGSNLYVLESEISQSYQRCSSMAGKQVCDIPSTNVGGSTFCISVSNRGMDIQKALESSSTMIVEFPNEAVKSTWLRELVQSTYRASAPPSADILDGLKEDQIEFGESRSSNEKAADLVVNGAVTETKFSLYGKYGDDEQEMIHEKLILKVFACGGKVYVSSCASDLTVKVKLNSLKIKDELQGSQSTHSHYLACSVINDQHLCSTPSKLETQEKDMSAVTVEKDDVFTDALPDFITFHDSLETHENDLSKGNIANHNVFYEAMGPDDSDFVSVTFLTRNPGSPDYDGIDTQMSIRMSKLEFYCNRPTLIALINIGSDLNSANSGVNGPNLENPDEEPVANNNKIEEYGPASCIEGLLGFGKGRVVFNLHMNVDTVTIFLNKEDGSQLAMFVQESFLLDIKVHPCSTSIESSLGNFRLCDLSLGSNHCWGWLCDLRNQEVESLIQFSFNSYSIGDDDYPGYDYSLSGRLCTVRIVFLYRFVQEITAYFMELATPHTEEAIKLVDKVKGIEWLIQKYEVDGASAVKLDILLDNPMIIVPQNSLSKDFIQLDLGHLRISNSFSWHGCPEEDSSAVHLDVLDVEMLGINMAAGINGSIAKPMIREGREVHAYVRRSLRDVFHKVPTFCLEVKVGSLHAAMSDKEYSVILDCFHMNLCELPNLPPSFRSSKSSARDRMKLPSDKVDMNSQVLLSRIVTTVAVEVDYALLELCYGADKESPLAHVILEGLWLSYRMTSLSEADLYITIPKFSILDIRPNTKAEMRLMLGSCPEGPKQISPEHNVDLPNSTMFLMDGRWRLSSKSFVVRAQQPRILFVPDFLLAVCEFFVPALGTITGRDEMMDPKNDPISMKDNIVLSTPLYRQTEDVVQLSPNLQLVADAVEIVEYVYDGCGKTISLVNEDEKNNVHVSVIRPIIIVGRGKRLRFVNVKFENGMLLKKYIYLGSDSSYSVSLEDGVEISFLDDNSMNKNHKDSDYLEEVSQTSHAPETGHCNSSRIPSFSFEAKVVSPEFTFYDSSKSFLDDSTHGEKLLRAKTDFSFMYASKEDDRWIRGFLEDLTLESGSGLVVLDPVDVSGGYTSVKDKTNISIIFSDIYAHLSLSVLSLLLNLQSQASTALQFGNADPLSPCTNFDRIWVSPKENGRLSNLTFWRPRAPSNYAVLGDCVTSGLNPPSQSVLAVSNTYGRVRKPLEFKLIGSFSCILGKQTGEGLSDNDNDNDCSLWLPVAPAGYLALGCVAHTGNQPPPNHTVHCIRSDLVTSTTYTECLVNCSANLLFESGFSIWRLDNCLGSFYAHPYADSPSRNFCFDLNHLLLMNSKRSEHKNPFSKTSNQCAPSSGWDALRSFSKASAYYMSTPNFERIWWDRGGDLSPSYSIWRPVPRLGYAILGDCISEGLENPPLCIIFKTDDPEISAKPVQFTKVCHIGKKGSEEAFFWYPVAPPGYVSLGCILTLHDEAPSLESICCPRMDLVSQANIAEMPISSSSSSKESHCWSIWKVENQACTFLARSDLKKPSSILAFTIGDSIKPTARDNITAKMEIRCLSLTVLDNFCGMMNPLFDATITNIKLASHGRFESMNAVLIFSFAASTFNTYLEAWEPLVEPFEGIFKLETYGTNLSQPENVSKRMRIAAVSTLNVNLSAANVGTLAQTMDSWRRQRERERKARRLFENAVGSGASDRKSTHLALDEDDFQTVIVENKLGCDIYLKKSQDTVNLLCHDGSADLWIPPPRFSDRLNILDESREPRCYVGVQIFEAKGLPLLDDGNSNWFFCVLRLLVENQKAKSQNIFPQSARTKCVKPLTTEINGSAEGTAKWNELFFFEVPQKGIAKLEVEVTNLAAKAGKGEVVGACSFSVGHGTSLSREVASVKMLHQMSDVQSTASYPLKTQAQNIDEMHSHCCITVSSSLTEKNMVTDYDKKCNDGDMGFWIGLDQKGPWDGFRSLLPLAVIPRKLKDEFVALEVSMKDGKKHALFRGLAIVTNESDIRLNISTCPVSLLNDHDISSTVSDWARTNHDFLDITICPNDSSVLPWRSMSRDFNQCLRIRPSSDDSQPSYAWGHPVSVEKDSLPADQASLSCQSTSKPESKTPISPLRLDLLENKDLLWCCPGSDDRSFWLSIGTDASVLHTDHNTPVNDWKILASSPLRLENKLPCSAEFEIWESQRDGKSIERQHGFISSRGTVHIYSADIRNPIYLTLFVQNSWVMEKDPVPILDVGCGNHVSSFWMLHQQTKRRLRVSIERDLGGTAAAPKTIRFFVPYWINNESFLPLAYRAVEIEPLENVDAVGKQVGMKRNIQVLEAIEDTSPTPSMLSPQDYIGRGGVMLFSPQNDMYLSPRVGISVAIRNSENFSPGVSLLELEKKQRVDTMAFHSDGTYHKLSAVMSMTSDRTKVVHFQPHTMFINRVGYSICIQQCDTQSLDWLHPTEPPKHFGWQTGKSEVLKLRVDKYQWSAPFTVASEGLMSICLRSELGSEQINFSIEVRGGTKTSHYEVIFRPCSYSSPYRIENRSSFLLIQFRQVDGSNDSWRSLLPNATTNFSWEDLGRKRFLEVLLEGDDPMTSLRYDIDEIKDHEPTQIARGPMRGMRVSVIKEEKVNVVKICDWMPENEAPMLLNRNISSVQQSSQSQLQPTELGSDSEFHLILEVADLGLSVVDHTPEEILYLSLQKFFLSYSTERGSGISRLKIRMGGIQVDNQLCLTPVPVVFRPQRVGEDTEYILKLSVTQQSSGSPDLCIYPYIGLQGPENIAFLTNIHEPIIWRLHGLIKQANLSRFFQTQSTSVSVDPIIQVGVLNISEIRFKVTTAMSPTQRPVGVLGFWASLMTALGNTENMPVRINQRVQENVSMRHSVLVNNAISNIKKDILSQPLQLLSGVDVLGNASSALGHMSKGVAALSMDDKFIQSRQGQDNNKGVEDLGDVIQGGGGALAKGFFRGFTGILTKPLEGAKTSGVEGFVQGVGKGLIGAAAQPVSGVLDLLSKTTEGANAVRMKIASAIVSEDQSLRRRLPRVVSGDHLLRPYDEYKAQGQAILQLAESGSSFVHVDMFKVRGKFALTDAYEDHFPLPKGRFIMVTHRRVVLLQQPANLVAQKNFSPVRDPCSVVWDVAWDDLATMELSLKKKAHLNAPPSRVVLSLHSKSVDGKDQIRVIKCDPDSNQASVVYSSIEQARSTYAPTQSKALVKRKVTKPYSPKIDAEIPEGGYTLSPKEMPSSVSLTSSLGAVND